MDQLSKKRRVRKSCSPVRLRPLRQLRAVPIQPRRQRKARKAGASCSNPSVSASLIGLPFTHSTTSPSCCLLLPLGKSNWRARASPSAAAAAPRPGCAQPNAPHRTAEGRGGAPGGRASRGSPKRGLRGEAGGTPFSPLCIRLLAALLPSTLTRQQVPHGRRSV